MPILYLMCGIPGSGKSTWVKNHLKIFDRYVSRDEIRFSMVAEDEEYFSKETEVFKEFCRQINKYLKNGYNVFADATHINEASRRKLLKEINEEADIQAVHIKTSLALTLERNENRKNTRSYVPTSVIRRMSCQFVAPTLEEGFSKIYTIYPDRIIEVQQKGDK